MAAATQLSLYNGALRALGQTKLSSLSEDREARYVLDDEWADDPIKACLEMGLWNFAMASVSITQNVSETPLFGYTYAFDKPANWVRTAAVCYDEYFKTPNLEYNDETVFYFANVTPIYVQYISDDVDYGRDYSIWPESFRTFVHHYLAWKICPTLIKNSSERDVIFELYKEARSEAKNRDAMNEATRFPPQGTWTRGRRGGSRDRGNRGSLLG